MTTVRNTTTRESVPLNVLARASWSAERNEPPPTLPGFTASRFAPIIAHVADLCLRDHHKEPPVPGERGESTALVLVSQLGDMATEAAVVESVDKRTKASPLLFFQSVPSAVLGVVAARWNLGGAVISVAPAGDPLTEAIDLAQLLIETGSAKDVLLVLVELAVQEGLSDHAQALLVCAEDLS